MKSLKDQLGTLVYSTDVGATCKGCSQAIAKCICSDTQEDDRLAQLDGVIRIHRETKGRKGKGVTLVKGVALKEKELKALAKSMKQHCGTGGSVKNGVIEIQGDQRELLKAFLQKREYQVKLAGG